MVGGSKEAKAFEDEFRKAQKPWAKKLGKVQKCRKDYHSACKLEKAAVTQLSAESASNSEQVKKLQDRVDKCQKDVENTKDKYEETLAVLHKYNSTYIDDMTDVFGKTQDFEEKRLRFFKDILIAVHGCLDISRSNELPRIYDQLRQTINMSDASKDLKWWSQNHGVEMAMLWPTFEEFSTDPANVSRKEKARSMFVTSSDTNIHAAAAGDRNGGVAKVPPTTRDVPPRPAASAAHVTVSQPIVSQSVGANPFDEDGDEEDFSNVVGVPVEALYDYVGQEDDELSFKKGEQFEKLKDRDDQGWCTGRKNGRVGLYPDNYIKLLSK